MPILRKNSEAMLRIAIIGYGKMGRAIEEVALERGHSVALRIDTPNRSELSAVGLRSVDVAIEFTSPSAARQNVEACLSAGTPVVCGTTGWNEEAAQVIERVRAGEGTLFLASNYSVGVNIFLRLSAMASRLFARIGGYGVDIQEIHHAQKLDAPSGTAMAMANAVAAENPNLNGWTLLPERGYGKIPITSIREGAVPGTHTLTFESDQDSIVLLHEAKSRRGFALGAVLAAEFIVGKKGFYTMDSLLHFD